VPFYGLIPSPSAEPDWSSLQAPVQGHYGEDDDRCTPEERQRLEVTLSDLGKDVEVFVYPDAGHGFFDDTRPEAYHGASASLAWTRTLEFLRAKLG
jgi:carboxymethylenebutenolidase